MHREKKSCHLQVHPERWVSSIKLKDSDCTHNPPIDMEPKSKTFGFNSTEKLSSTSTHKYNQIQFNLTKIELPLSVNKLVVTRIPAL